MRTLTARRTGAFTIVEMVVVLALLALLIAFAYPRLAGNETAARDQKAQTSASAALAAVTSVVSSIGARAAVAEPLEGPGCTTQAPATVRRITDGKPYPVQNLTDAATTYATSCPLFANPVTLASTTGDVRFVGGSTASTGPQVASVAATNTGLAWRVAVAVLAPVGGQGTTRSAVSTCWVAWREFPLGGVAGGLARERYFYNTGAVAADASNCTGQAGLTRGTPPPSSPTYSDALPDGAACENPAPGSPRRGTSWRNPCGDYGLVP